MKAEAEAKQANENAERLKAEKLTLVGEIDSLKARLKDQQQQLATANQSYQDLEVSLDHIKAEHEALSTEVLNSKTKHKKTRNPPLFFLLPFQFDDVVELPHTLISLDLKKKKTFRKPAERKGRASGETPSAT